VFVRRKIGQLVLKGSWPSSWGKLLAMLSMSVPTISAMAGGAFGGDDDGARSAAMPNVESEPRAQGHLGPGGWQRQEWWRL